MTVAPAVRRSRALATPPRVMAAAVLLATAIGLLGVALSTSDRPTLAVVWGSLALAAYAGSLLCVAGGGRGAGLGLSRWCFGSWTLLWYGVAFGLATLTWTQPQTGAAAEIAVSSVLRALWLVAVGMTCWAIGYFAGPGRLAGGLAARGVGGVERRFAPEVRSLSAPWILYGVGTAARIGSAVTTGRFGYVGDAASIVSAASGYGQILNLLSLCAPLAIGAAALQVYRERLPGARVTLAVLFLAELGFGAAAGGKQSFVIAVLAVAIPFSAARHRLPKPALALLALLFLVVVIPFNQAYRTAARGGTAQLSAAATIAAAPGIFRQTVTGHDLLTVLPGSVDYLLQRIREIDGPAIILQRTPGQVGFLSPARLIEGTVTELVPRAIWPGKPIVAVGYQISQKYYGFSASVYSSSSVTPVGDLYRHGGWVPVIAGMLLLGCGVRLLDDVLDAGVNPHAIFLVLLLLPTLVKNELDFVSLLASIPGTIVIWLLAVQLTFRRRRPGVPPRALLPGAIGQEAW